MIITVPLWVDNFFMSFHYRPLHAPTTPCQFPPATGCYAFVVPRVNLGVCSKRVEYHGFFFIKELTLNFPGILLLFPWDLML